MSKQTNNITAGDVAVESTIEWTRTAPLGAIQYRIEQLEESATFCHPRHPDREIIRAAMRGWLAAARTWAQDPASLDEARRCVRNAERACQWPGETHRYES